MSTGADVPYRPSTALAVWTVILLLAAVIADAASALSTAAVLPLIDRARVGALIPDDVAAQHDQRRRLIAGGQIMVSLAAWILFLMWVYRTNRNARALGADGMKYTPGWSVGWFFVPVANLWMPCLVMQELWRATSPELIRRWRQASGSTFVGIWWAVSLMTGMIQYSPWALAFG
jgi:hypothetical protein